MITYMAKRMNDIIKRYKLSEEFIERHADKVNWNYISYHQKLSEEFIERNVDKVNWEYISIRQKLSEGFIERYADRVDWANISIYHQGISEEFRLKYRDRLTTDRII